MNPTQTHLHRVLNPNLFKQSEQKNIFKSTYKMYIVADATDPSIISNYYSQLDKLGIHQSIKSKINPRFTLMEIHINRQNPDYQFIVDSSGKIITNLYKTLELHYAIFSKCINITSENGVYDMMEDFFAKLYMTNDSSYITRFRTGFYKYLQGYLGKGSRSTKFLNGKNYVIYSYNGRPLIAIPDCYHGNGKWCPHLFLINKNVLQKDNPKLYDNFIKSGITSLINIVKESNNVLNNINMYSQFKSIRITVVAD